MEFIFQREKLLPRTVYEHNALNAAFLFGFPSLPPSLSREPLSSRWLKKLIPFSRIKYVYSTCIFREHRVSSTTLVGRDHGCISLIQIWHGSKYRKHAFFFFFFSLKDLYRKFGYTFVTQYFFFYLLTCTVGQHRHVPRVRTRCA